MDMKRIFFLALIFCMGVAVQAQPTKRRSTTSNAAAQQGNKRVQASDRAALMFPTNVEVPEDVVWKRDIYRQLDLTKDKNAPLYYPTEPIGTQCNLFTYLFRLVLTGRLSAYNYKLDGNESFAAKDKITDVKEELLNRYSIFFEETDGKLNVADNDVPSAQVKRYYIKESVVLDQRTGTYKTRVMALCPILIEADDFGESSTPKPLFWIKYDDVAAYLTRLPVMASNYNNTSNMSADDFFAMNLYEGTIYKTNNMQGRVLSDYCKTDSAMRKEQKKIEGELQSFEESIWKVKLPVDSTAVDSTLAEKEIKQAKKKSTSSRSKEKTTTTRTNRRSQASASIKEKDAPKAATQPRASVRRTRR